MTHSPSRTFTISLLFAVNFVNFFDRQILASVVEPLRLAWGLTDTQIGWLVTVFTLIYAVVGLPLGRAADLLCRKWILCAGLAVWSGLTWVSGLCQTFSQLLAARLGVGGGEASCAPAATSLIGDLYPPSERARAMATFMLGLPAGIAASYFLGGLVAQHFGWRSVFFIAGAPGLLLAAAALFIREPVRGASDTPSAEPIDGQAHASRRVLSIPSMYWIIASALVHNFVLYAFTFFLPSFLVRHHHTSLQSAGAISALVVGCAGAAGMLAGGALGDAARNRMPGGRLKVAAAAVSLAAPLWFAALWLPAGSLPAYVALQTLAALLMYIYYPTVYATIHDLVEPAFRGRAMAIYLFAMYLLGASWGPVAAGRLSDVFARRAAREAGASPGSIPEQFRAVGLHQAMLTLPVLLLLLAGILLAGALAMPRDRTRAEIE